MDEFRISSVARSSNWIATAFDNIDDNHQFICFGPVLRDAPFITNARGATQVTLSSADLNGDLVSTGSNPTDVRLYWGPTDGGSDISAWSNVSFFGLQPPGSLTTNLIGLSNNTIYYYRYWASNAFGRCWAEPTETFFTGGLDILATDSNAAEAGINIGTFEIRRPPAFSTNALTVSYTVSGTASAVTDYQPLSGSLTIPAGFTTVSFDVTPIDDNVLDENLETVIVTLDSGPFAINPGTNNTIYIQDNDIGITNWKTRLKINVCGYDKAEPLTNFPLLVVLGTNIPGFHFGQFHGPNGADLEFRNADESVRLNHEIEGWNVNGEAHIWVQVDRLVSNGCIYALWDHHNLTNPAPYTTNGSTWSEDYLAVWHFNRTAADSATVYDGTLMGDPAFVQTGP
ncbi:MAG: Calx-beta domain-containing protein, partial [Verrucomicrobiota bacterium]